MTEYYLGMISYQNEYELFMLWVWGHYEYNHCTKNEVFH